MSCPSADHWENSGCSHAVRGLLSRQPLLEELDALRNAVIAAHDAYHRHYNILAIMADRMGHRPLRAHTQLHLSSHQPLMMVTKRVSRMFDSNSIFTLLI